MSKRKPLPPPDEGPGWLATYGDLVTLLMAFFVMLFAISSVQEDKFEALLAGFGAFGNPAADVVIAPIGQQATTPVPIPAPAQPVSPPVTAAPEVPPPAPAPPVPDPALVRLGEQLLEAVAAAGQPGTVDVRVDLRGLTVAIATDDVLFDVGSTQVTDRGLAILAAIAPSLSSVNNELLVEGHADSSPLNRGGYTNWNLSTDRAVAVLDVLAGRHAIAPHRLSAAGFGEFRPLDPGDSPAAKARNRRVELVVRDDQREDPIQTPITPIVVPSFPEQTP